MAGPAQIVIDSVSHVYRPPHRRAVPALDAALRRAFVPIMSEA
jgi:hypothetical protein